MKILYLQLNIPDEIILNFVCSESGQYFEKIESAIWKRRARLNIVVSHQKKRGGEEGLFPTRASKDMRLDKLLM